MIDLHMHSICSDGVLTPRAVVERAAGIGITAMALADHDSVSGIDEAMEAAEEVGITVVPAVELSVAFRRFRDVHLLGYYIDHRDERFAERLASFRTARASRGAAILERINRRLTRQKKTPVALPPTPDERQALGRPHLARLLLERGYVTDMEDAFRRYLEPCDVPKQYFPMEEALTEIRRIGGISVLAHPQSITRDRQMLRDIVSELASMGLDGIEIYQNMSLPGDIPFLENLAREQGLLVTGGSDFHEPTELVPPSVPAAIFDALTEKAKKRKKETLLPLS